MIYRWFLKSPKYSEWILAGEYSSWEQFDKEFRNKIVMQYNFNGLNILHGRDMANNILAAVKKYGNGLCVEDPNTKVEYSFEIID